MVAYYPVFLDLKDKPVLVVGGGRVAERKVYTLLDAGAKITIIAKEISYNLNGLLEQNKALLLGRRFLPRHLDGVFLVIAATDDPQLNAEVAREARRRGVLVNAVDQPEECTFILPSLVKRGDLIIAVSTSGKSPALAKKLRKRLEDEFGPEYEMFLALMGRVREYVLSLDIPQEHRSNLFHRLVDSALLERLREGDTESVARVLRELLPPDSPVDKLMEVITESRGR